VTATALPGTSARLSPVIQYALLAGPLLAMLDSSIVNVAVEPISRQLHAGLPLVQWAVSGYLLALGTGLAATAYLARRLGTQVLYRASISAFTLASACCALAPSIQLLLATRMVQGLVAAPLVPMAMSMLFGPGSSARSMPVTAGLLLFLGPALGPSIGGALIGAVGWRSIFLINLPTGAAAIVAARRIPAAMAPGRAAARLDLPGLVLLSAGLAALLLGITLAGVDGWTATASWLPMLAGALLLAGYALWSRRTQQPALNLALARSRGPVLALTLCAMASVVTFSVVFLLPVFVQSAQGHSPLATGLAMLPQGILTGLSTAVAPRVLRKVTVRTTVLAGFAFLTAGSLGLLAIGARTPLAVTAALLAVRSVSIGLVIAPLLAVLTAPLGSAEITDASTLFSIWQRIAGSLGVGIVAAVFTEQEAANGPLTALHFTGCVIAAISAAGLALSPLLPAGQTVPPYGSSKTVGPRARRGPTEGHRSDEVGKLT
jgi:EmrB/QacA subfamily drug resistance transporter